MLREISPIKPNRMFLLCKLFQSSQNNPTHTRRENPKHTELQKLRTANPAGKCSHVRMLKQRGIILFTHIEGYNFFHKYSCHRGTLCSLGEKPTFLEITAGSTYIGGSSRAASVKTCPQQQFSSSIGNSYSVHVSGHSTL